MKQKVKEALVFIIALIMFFILYLLFEDQLPVDYRYN